MRRAAYDSPKRILARAVVAMLAALLVSPLPSKIVSAQSAERTTVEYDDIRFDLPGPGWERTINTPRQIQYTHKLGDQRVQSVGIWPVMFPPSLADRSQSEHTAAIFMLERMKPRYEGRWEGFDEGTRVVGDRTFPTMSFKITLAEKRYVTDGLFVLYFPQGFEQRRKFFTFMWLDGHADNQPGSGLDALDVILSSVSAKP